jgi:aminoglycoside phosphotransferase (APT) family kinase protein
MVSSFSDSAAVPTGWTIPGITVTVNTVTLDTEVPARLLGALQRVTGISCLAYAREPEPLKGGFWADLYTFSLAHPPSGWPTELVARVMPDEGLARKETIVQATVAAAGYPTPAVRASGDSKTGLGRAFMVMDKANGASLLSGLNGLGVVTSAPRVVSRIPDLLATASAQLHDLDPEAVRVQFERIGVPASVGELLRTLHDASEQFGRADLVDASQWLLDHPPRPTPDVICHGDMHPFNLLVDGDQITVLDWSTALLAPRAHDVAFTSLLLSEPPVLVPAPLRPIVRRIGAGIARRFVRVYQERTNVALDADELQWHRGVVCLRALVEVASWADSGIIDTRIGHPWLVTGPALANRLTTLTAVPVRSR